MKATFRGGVHPAHGSKAQTQGLATRSFVSDTVRIIMNMNIGAPSQPCVAKGDHVKIGQVIGEPVGFLACRCMPACRARWYRWSRFPTCPSSRPCA